MSYAQSETESLIGKKVPDLTFGPIMNHSTQNAKLSDYGGKIVILDFWATWCRGCIKAFPHLEALKEKFFEDIEILAISSSDSKERIEKFLSKKQTTLPIVLDTARVLAKKFPHRTLSHTVVIDANRIVRAISSPENITEDVIQNILDQKKIDLEEKRYDFSWSKEDHLSPKDAIFQFTLTPFQGGSQMMQPFKNGRLLINGLRLRSLYEYANGFPMYTRTIVDVENEEEHEVYKYSLEIIAPNMTVDEVRPIMLDLLHKTFPLKSRVEKRKVPVKVLQRTTEPLNIKSADPTSKKEFWFSGRGIHIQNRPIDKNFTRFLERMLTKKDQITIVVNETDLRGNYDIDIPWYAEDPGNIHDELRKLGLMLLDAEREVDFLLLYKETDKSRVN